MAKRNYGIDLLRMVSMFMVVVLHVLGQGGILAAVEKLSFGYWLVWTLETACYCAVNCFALISGYTMSASGPKVSRLAEVWLQTVCYTVLITGAFFFLVPAAGSTGLLLSALFPITRKHYWYISAYFGLYLLSPLLNAAIAAAGKKSLAAVLSAAFVFLSLLPTVFQTDPYVLNEGYSLLWLCLLYLAGGFVRKYDVLSNVRRRTGWLLFFSMVLFTLLVKALLEYTVWHTAGVFRSGGFLIRYTSPTITLAAVGLLLVCGRQTLSPAAQKAVAVLAPASLGVYLIHVCSPVWNHLFKGFSVVFLQYHPLLMLILVLLSALAVYAGCSLVDLLRIRIFHLLHIPSLCMRLDGLAAAAFEKAFRRYEDG